MSTRVFITQVGEIESFLRSFALSLTQNQSDSDDLVQDTLHRAMRNLDKYKDGTNFRAWMATIMKNIFINNYRRKTRQNTKLDGLDERTSTIIDRNHFEINTASSNLSEELIVKEIDALKDDLRLPFLMHVDGFKYEEIALQLDVPLGTIKSRIFHARRILRLRLTKLGY
ncbi:MAG TPA: RNA polymerase subunit sigma [Bacteroidetes bacterium]|nr:RNA polymerase subunit sigma [Bacteroidota bacterium]|tara:strand:+ start:205 stop:714 length:510 start_codon:yes stop_codon:yes gene_type:complete